jgi:ubiquinone/menaquinone biosynthesis C-methylase UbiE
MRRRRSILGRIKRHCVEVSEAVRSLRAVYHSKPENLKPGTKEYERRAEEEKEYYKSVFSREDAAGQLSRETLMEPAPASWVEVQRRTADLIRGLTGKDVTEHAVSRLQSRPGVRMLSLGSGPGGVELAFARDAPSAEILCLDLNADVLRLGESSATAEGLPVRFEQADLNTVTLPKEKFDIVFCHASLHHIVELERLVEQIKTTLRPEGELMIVDVITRHGYRMWPETRKVVQTLWQTLPARYRTNHTAYGEPRVDRKIWETDTRRSGMECIRSEDILPLLADNFATRTYVPYLSLCRRFFDTMYGPNYDLDRPLDRAILDWIWELDCHYISSGRLRPETFFGIYGKGA